MALKAQVPVVPVAIQGGDGVDEEGQSDRPADDGQRADRGARRDARHGPFRSREARRYGARARRRTARARAPEYVVSGFEPDYCRPGFLLALSISTACRSRLCFVTSRLAVSTHATYIRRYEGARLSKNFQARACLLDRLLDIGGHRTVRDGISTTGRPSGTPLRGPPPPADWLLSAPRIA